MHEPSGSAVRNSRAEAYVLASIARARNSRANALSTDGSSSTIAIQGEACAMRGTIGVPVGRCRVGPKANSAATGYDLPWAEIPAFSVSRTRSATERTPSFFIIRPR